MNFQTKTSPEFGEEYYRTGNYADYLERGPRYHQIAIELDQLFQTLNICSKFSRIVDYGCGVGFLCSSLMRLGYINACGLEVSGWAARVAESKGVTMEVFGKSSGMIALDVFEHMEDFPITRVIRNWGGDFVLCRMPIAKERETQFALEISRKDKTHINCKTKSQWIQFFKDLGYPTVLRLNMRTIYDSEGVACLLALSNTI